jgi:hypothetical protein
MKIENQVCTLEQGKTFKSLGINQGSYFRWIQFRNESSPPDQWGTVHTVLDKEDDMLYYYERSYLKDMEDFPALTVAELGVMMPARVMSGGDDYFPQMHKGRRGWYIQYQTNKKDVVINADGDIDRPRGYLFNTYRVAYNMAEAIASYLILLLENNVITPAEVNERLKATQ